MHVINYIRYKSNKDYIFFLMRNFAINNRYLYDRMSFIKKITVINKIVPDFMDTLYSTYGIHGVRKKLLRNCIILWQSNVKEIGNS